MDRLSPQMAKCQTTFISFVVSPLVKSFKTVMKSELLDTLTANLEQNDKNWTQILASDNQAPL